MRRKIKKLTEKEVIAKFKPYSAHYDRITKGVILHYDTSVSKDGYCQYELHLRTSTNNLVIYKYIDRIAFDPVITEVNGSDIEKLNKKEALRYLIKELKFSVRFISQIYQISQSSIYGICEEDK